MSIELHHPFSISSRLLPSVKVGDATISIEYAGNEPDGRVRYRYYIDFADGTEHVGEDLRSGVQGGSLREGMESLLAFLDASAEGGENEDLFPPVVVEWARQNDSKIAGVRAWIEVTENCCVETR